MNEIEWMGKVIEDKVRLKLELYHWFFYIKLLTVTERRSDFGLKLIHTVDVMFRLREAGDIRFRIWDICKIEWGL